MASLPVASLPVGSCPDPTERRGSGDIQLIPQTILVGSGHDYAACQEAQNCSYFRCLSYFSVCYVVTNLTVSMDAQ